MEYINDLVAVYKGAFKETGEILKKVPLIVFLPLIFSLVTTLVYTALIGLLGRTGILLGFILAIVQAILLSAYFSFLDEAISYRRFKLAVDSTLTRYARSIYAVMFVFYLASLLIGNVLAVRAIAIIIFILLNPLGETIYVGHRYGMDAINYSFSYLQDNWYIWLPHTLIYVLLGYLRRTFFTFNPLDMYVSSLSLNPLDLIIMALLGIYFIFRGVLFKNTKDSSMRKRKYMGVWN